MGRKITGNDYDDFVSNWGLSKDHEQHTMAECPTCGSLEWVYSSNGEKEVIIIPKGGFDKPCGICIEVCQRNPEIYQWVINVIGKHSINRI